jgi:hypothetical protein
LGKSILKSTQGVFSLAAEEIAVNHYPVAYMGIANDRRNLSNDMINVCSDIRTAVNEAKINSSK